MTPFTYTVTVTAEDESEADKVIGRTLEGTDVSYQPAMESDHSHILVIGNVQWQEFVNEHLT